VKSTGSFLHDVLDQIKIPPCNQPSVKVLFETRSRIHSHLLRQHFVFPQVKNGCAQSGSVVDRSMQDQPEVRAIAKKAGLATAEKKDSQGLCFIGKVHLPDFLQQRLEPKKGKVIEVLAGSSVFKNGISKEELVAETEPYHFSIGSGEVVGEHNGAHFYTIGQRKGLDITFGKPVYVTGIYPENNTVVLGEEDDLNRQEMTVGRINWMKYDGITDGMEAVTKIRYKDSGTLSNLYHRDNNILVKFYDYAKGVAPGQSAVFFEGDDVIGGGIIQRPALI